MTPTPRQILERARTLIAAPESWCKGPREVRDGKVVARCAIVAWSHAISSYGIVVVNDERFSAQNAAWHALRKARAGLVPGHLGCLATYNDAESTTHADILALYDRAIESCPAEPDNSYVLARFT